MDKACAVETMDRCAVEVVKCLHCGLEQAVAQACAGCGVGFGEYFCRICRFYENKDRGQFHCEGCGICRVGGRDRHRHCDICRVCYNVDFFSTHKVQ
jgi:RING finger/CHY zinc finger protein 1